jgi:cell division protein FtsZ
VDISDANRALINVIGGMDMTLREAEMIVEVVGTRINPNAHIIWGAMVDEQMPRSQIQAMIVIAGGKIPFLDAPARQQEKMDLGIEFTE